eukprot:TRINITY_DN2326_c0_g1_i2.p1 TRINITY_DN2326_c0_g1~~TRINITY_DN2326_c0_g1_i2.p1  ORF type:complete len:262 (+),score=54.34 TRINITY_DN2326_c0_g1_i2:622-1407(+)
MATEDMTKTLRDKLSLQKKELATKQRTLNTFNLVEGKPFEGRKVYECPKCKGKCFTSKGYLKAHCKRRHPEGIDEAPSLKKQTGLEKESQDVYSEQAEELKLMQTKLKTLIAQATLSMNSAEGVKDDHEILKLRQTINELDDKYRKMQDQLYELQNTQRHKNDQLSSIKISKPPEQKSYQQIIKETPKPLSMIEERGESRVYSEKAIRRVPVESEVRGSRFEETKGRPPIDERRSVRSTISNRKERSFDYKGEKNMLVKSL